MELNLAILMGKPALFALGGLILGFVFSRRPTVAIFAGIFAGLASFAF